jgi:hypothetical protein
MPFPVNAILRGGAVLALLLCLLPRVSALTMTQTSSFTTNGSGFGNVRGGMGGEWIIPAFYDGYIDSVLFAATIEADCFGTNFNTTGSPTFISASVGLDTTFYLALDPFASESSFASSPSVLAPPNAGTSVTAHFTQSASRIFSSQSHRALFMGGARIDVVGFVSGSSAGTFRGNETVSMSVTYQYHVPDNSTTGALMFLTMSLLGVSHLRMNRSRPTL